MRSVCYATRAGFKLKVFFYNIVTCIISNRLIEFERRKIARNRFRLSPRKTRQMLQCMSGSRDSSQYTHRGLINKIKMSQRPHTL